MAAEAYDGKLSVALNEIVTSAAGVVLAAADELGVALELGDALDDTGLAVELADALVLHELDGLIETVGVEDGQETRVPNTLRVQLQ